MIEIFENFVSGFTTYKNEMSNCVRKLGHKLHIITLDAPVNEFCLEHNCMKEEIIKVPHIRRFETLGCILSLYIKDTKETVFIHNFAVSYPVLSLLKSYFPLSKLVYVIHDFIWASYLMGDIELYKRIISRERRAKQYNEIYSFYEDGLKSFNLADKTICLSMDTYKLLHDFYRINYNKIVYIPNGLRDDSTVIHNSGILRNSMRLTKKDKIFLYVGRLTKQKGIFCLLEAFDLLCREYSNAYLVIAGDFNSDFISQIPIASLRNIILLGRVEKNTLYKWYHEADFGVIPSRYEQCSYTGIETKMHSLPVIVSDAFGVKCMFNDMNSIMVRPNNNQNDAHAFYNGLKRAMEMSDFEIGQLKIRTREDYKKVFSFEKMCTNYKERLFDNLKN